MRTLDHQAAFHLVSQNFTEVLPRYLLVVLLRPYNSAKSWKLLKPCKISYQPNFVAESFHGVWKLGTVYIYTFHYVSKHHGI